MRSTLYIKLLIFYVIFGFLSFFTVATLTTTLTKNQLRSQTAGSLYRNANLLAHDYLPGYFADSLSKWDITVQLNGMQTYLGADVWFVNKDGEILAYAKSSPLTIPPSAIENFNPLEAGNNRYLIGDYHKLFQEEVLTVVSPVTHNYLTKGYLLIHAPTSAFRMQSSTQLRPVYISIFVIFMLSFIILLAFHYIIYVPLRRITEAAKQYALGNLDYDIPITTQDEIGLLSASLNYMSNHLRDMEDYQKKFVANVSHDFRSPLTSIKGYVEAIEDGTIPPEQHDKYLKIILFETDRLKDLTEDLLSLNDLGSKGTLLNKEPFDIHEMIKNTAASFEGSCRNKRITIELFLASRALYVVADKRKIQQIFYNLLDNAIKFSHQDSIITVETTDKGEKALFTVKDEGEGIPKDNINKIWERFYKSDSSRGKDRRGTGLGLAIVKEALAAHGETINVISTSGVGSEFIFSLPKATSTVEPNK